MLRKASSSALICALIAACSGSDPTAANPQNFKAAIQKHLDRTNPRCYLVHKIPASLEMDIGGIRKKFQALARAGILVEKEDSRKEVKSLFGSGTTAIVKTSFHLTDEGKKYYKADAIKSTSGEHIGGLCFGRATAIAVTQFSEPADRLGLKASNVNYTYSVSDLPAWARSPEVTEAIEALKVDAASEGTPANARATLVLTNTGWVHESDFKRQ